MQLSTEQKKYSLAILGTILIAGIVLLLDDNGGLLRSSVLFSGSDSEVVYNNPLEDNYEEKAPSYDIDLNSLESSPYTKIYSSSSLGAEGQHMLAETSSGALAVVGKTNVKNFRIAYNEDKDPLSGQMSSALFLAKTAFLTQAKNVFPGITVPVTETDKLLTHKIETLSLEDFLKTTASGALFSPEPGKISIALNTAYTFDAVSNTANHLTGPLVQTASGTYIVNDVSTVLAKEKNIPLIALQNQEAVKKVKEVLQSQFVKRGFSSTVALTKTETLIADHISFELGSKVSSVENGYLDPKTYAEVAAASILKIKEIAPKAQIVLSVPANANGDWWNWGTQYNLKDLFQTLTASTQYSSIKSNIKGLSLSLPNYEKWKESLHSVRSIADAHGFGGTPLWIIGQEKSGNSMQSFEQAMVTFKGFLELTGRKDVAYTSIFSLFGDLAGVNVNGRWSNDAAQIKDPFLASLKTDTARVLPLGVLSQIFQKTFFSGENFTTKLFRSSEVLTEFFGQTQDGKKRGLVMNLTDSPKTYTLKNSAKLQVTEVTNTTASGSLIDQFGASAVRNVKIKEPFIFGVNGHPMNQESYKQTGAPSITEGVLLTEQLDRIQDMGLTSYRIDVGQPNAVFDQAVLEGKKRGITILPVIFPPVNLDVESDLAKIEKISHDYALDFAKKYKDDIPVWELHNEMDNYTQLRKGDIVNGQPWPWEAWMINGDTKEQHDEGRSAKVAAMMKGLTNGVHEADPKLKTTIDGGWLHFGYIQRMVDAGVNFDILSWHWYSSMGDITKVNGAVNAVAELAKFGKDIWITEGNKWGGDMGATGAEQAQYAKDIMLQMVNLPQVKAYYFYELLDEPYFGETNPESHFGLFQMKKSAQGTWIVDKPKPIVEVIKATTKLIREQEYRQVPGNESFELGMNGHPFIQEGYSNIGVSVEEQIALLKELGAKAYRHTVPKSDEDFDKLIAAAKKENIELKPIMFPVMFPILGLPEMDANGNEIKTADGSVKIMDPGYYLWNSPASNWTSWENITLEQIEQISYDYAFNKVSKYKNEIHAWEFQNELENYAFLQQGERDIEGKLLEVPGWHLDGSLKKHYNQTRYERVRATMRGMSRGVHDADPTAKRIIDAGWLHFGFLDRLTEDNVGFEVIAWHWYSNMEAKDDPKTPLKDETTTIVNVGGTINVPQKLNSYGKEVWINEGNSGYTDDAVIEENQSRYLTNTLTQLIGLYPQIKKYFIYELLNEPYLLNRIEAERKFGIVDIVKEGGRWVLGKKKLSFAAVGNLIRNYRLPESTLRDKYLAALRIQEFPKINKYTILPNTKDSVILTLPPKSAVFLSEDMIETNSEDLLLGSQDIIKNTASSYLPSLETAPRVSPEPPQDPVAVNGNSNAQNANLNQNKTSNGNAPILNTNQNLPSSVNLNLNTNARSSGSVTNSSTGSSGVSYAGGSAANANQNLKASAPVRQSSFKDITGHFASIFIDELAEKGVLQGRAPGKFDPNGTLNRAESTKAVVKAFYPQQDEVKFTEQFKSAHKNYTYMYFKDVPLQIWYAGFVGIAKEAGIVSGIDAQLFEPARSANRAEILKLLLTAKKVNVDLLSREFIKTNRGYFRDVSSTSWYAKYVYAAANLELIDKRTAFEPARSMTRGEFAKVLSLSLKIK
ncbi:MAG: S-layer homology domain-containing protein [Candidatus Gracilibacteria bacterium]